MLKLIRTLSVVLALGGCGADDLTAAAKRGELWAAQQYASDCNTATSWVEQDCGYWYAVCGDENGRPTGRPDNCSQGDDNVHAYLVGTGVMSDADDLRALLSADDNGANIKL